MSRYTKRAARGLLGLTLLFGSLELLTRAEVVDPASLPPASVVLVTTGAVLVDVEFLADLAGTLSAWLLGMLAAIIVAVPLGVLLGSSRRGYLASIATIELLRPIPSVALIPLAILLLGRGLDMKAALVAYASIWPILFNTIYGMRDVDPVAKDTARSFGLGPLAVLWKVSLRSASPFIYTGVRISASIALILAISSELIAGGGAGIGIWMLEHTQAGVPREFLYAAIVVAGMVGLLIDLIMVAGERRLFSWHPRLRATR